MSDVSKTRPEHKGKSITALTLAFSCDPVLRYFFCDPPSYLEHFPQFAQAYGGEAFKHGSAYHCGDFVGSALWLPPDIGPDENDFKSFLRGAVEPRKYDVALNIMDKMGAFHPTEPHWYLALIGVDNRHQGQGLGSKMLSAVVTELDRNRQLAHLDSTNHTNIPLYERFGFSLIGKIDVADCPPVFPMLRRPRPL